MITQIAAVGNNNEIGFQNQLLWRIPSDLKFFKQTTMGNIVVMGRKTYESIGKALPGRVNVVLTRDKNFTCPDADVIHDVEVIKEVDKVANSLGLEVFIIGGASIYEQTMHLCDRLLINYVNGEFPEADAYFPEIHWERFSVNGANLNFRYKHESDQFKTSITEFYRRGFENDA